ncbi:MAG: methyltransferase family protein [Candidatus Thorarchaeota archaeon]
MKGIQKFWAKLPNYKGKKKLTVFFVVFFTVISSLTFQIIIDSLPRIFPSIRVLQIIEPFTPIFGSSIVVSIGFLLVYLFWRKKDKYLLNYGNLAYQKAFKFVITGVPLVMTFVIHSYIPIDLIISLHGAQNLSWFLATPIFDIICNLSIVFLVLRIILWILFMGLGFIVVRRALDIFGIDYMGLVYVYYPEESTLQDHEIYSILRHPTYHSLILFSIGAIFFRFSIYSILYFLIFLLGINIHLKFVEEKELIERFGKNYIKYKKMVPALFIRFKNLKKYFLIILKKESSKEKNEESTKNFMDYNQTA